MLGCGKIQPMAHYIHGSIRIPDPGDPDCTEEFLLERIGRENDQLCPFCGQWYEDDAEWTYIDLGHYVQVSGNHCLECGASELGAYSMNPLTEVYKNGWTREKRPGDEDKYPVPNWVKLDSTNGKPPEQTLEIRIKSIDENLYDDPTEEDDFFRELYEAMEQD